MYSKLTLIIFTGGLLAIHGKFIEKYELPDLCIGLWKPAEQPLREFLKELVKFKYPKISDSKSSNPVLKEKCYGTLISKPNLTIPKLVADLYRLSKKREAQNKARSATIYGKEVEIDRVREYMYNLLSQRKMYKKWVEIENGEFKVETVNHPPDYFKKKLLFLLAKKQAREKAGGA